MFRHSAVAFASMQARKDLETAPASDCQRGVRVRIKMEEAAVISAMSMQGEGMQVTVTCHTTV